MSSQSKIIVVSPDAASLVDVAPMNSTLVKIETKGHRGPLKFFLNMSSISGDLTCYVHSNPKASSDSKLWTYRFDIHKPKPMTFTPFKAFDESLLHGKQTINDIDKNAWQPEALYAHFFSEDGCQFSLKAAFIEEELLRANRIKSAVVENPSTNKLMRGKFYEKNRE